MGDEEFQGVGAAGICSENWWRSSVFPPPPSPPLTSSSPCSSSTSPCSMAPPTDTTRTWQSSDHHHHCFMDLKAPSLSSSACDSSSSSNNNSNYHMGFHDAQQQQKAHNKTNTTDGSILMDSTLQMMGFGLSSPNWDHPSSLLDNNNSQIIQKDYWSRKSFGRQQQEQVSSTMDIFKRMNNQEFPSSNYGYPSSTLIQTLYDPQHSSSSTTSVFTNRSMSYSSSSTVVNYDYASNEVSLSPITWPNKLSSSSSSSSSLSLLPSSMAKHPNNIGLHFSNNTPFWNASAESLDDIRAGAFPSSQSQYKTPPFEEEDNKHIINCPTILLNKLKSEELCVEPSCVKKSNNVCSSTPALKRARIETPPPLPTFKVRKEKLGDRVTALQQLVSPFGKTDTASVLHEAIEYIKFLHDQVTVLSTPYMKSSSGASIERNQECDETMKESSEEGASGKQDLRSRGLCLVPISSTFPVATESSADFWTPTFSFGGALLR